MKKPREVWRYTNSDTNPTAILRPSAIDHRRWRKLYRLVDGTANDFTVLDGNLTKAEAVLDSRSRGAVAVFEG